MRILVAFKVTPDFELLRDADWAAAGERGVETRYVRRILNCFDESALELALRIADAGGTPGAAPDTPGGMPDTPGGVPDTPGGMPDTPGAATGGAPAGAPPVELGAVSIGDREVEPYLQTLSALGYERTARIDPGTGDAAAGLDFAPAVVAALIARYARRVDHSDLVLLGCRSGPGDGGTVPFRVAEELGWPCLAQVTELEALADRRLRATCAADDGLVRLTLRGPWVLSIGNAVVSSLRTPTLKQRLSRRDRSPAVLPATELGVDVSALRLREGCRLIGLEPIDRGRAGELVDGPTPQAKARALFERHLAELQEER